MCDKGGYTSSDKEALAAPLAVQQNHAHTHAWSASLWSSTQKTYAFSVVITKWLKGLFIIGLYLWYTEYRQCFTGTSVMPQETAD